MSSATTSVPAFSAESSVPTLAVASAVPTMSGASGAGVGSGEAGTAFIQVNPTAEAFQDDHDIYVCHPLLDTAVLEANTPPDSLKLYYTTPSLMPRFTGSTFWTALREVASEGDYFHNAFPLEEATRIAYGPTHWYVRPSAALGADIAAYFLTAADPYFDGAYEDEAQADIPDSYWNAWQDAAAVDLSGARAFWDTQWDAMHAAFQSAMKTGFGTGRALIANTAGATYAGLDGITIESSHIIAMGEPAALVAFAAQQAFWSVSANKYGGTPLSIAWDYDLNVLGLVFRGTIGVPP